MLAPVIIIIAYLIASLSSAIVLCKVFHLPDPRSQGSKNPGATNVLRIAGKGLAFSVLILDLLKGFGMIWYSKSLALSNPLVAIVGFAGFLGQLFPIFFNFRGGKGIAITLGILLGFSWQLALLCLAIWVLVFMWFRISSLAAIAATLCSIIVSFISLVTDEKIYLAKEFAICNIVLAILILFRHKTNLRQLMDNTENRFR